MTTTYRHNRRVERVSGLGGLVGAIGGAFLLVVHTTVFEHFWMFLGLGLVGLVLVGITRAQEEPPYAPLIALGYSSGAMTIGLLELTHDSVFILLATAVFFGGIVTIATAIERWGSTTTTLLGTTLGVVVAGLVLYVI